MSAAQLQQAGKSKTPEPAGRTRLSAGPACRCGEPAGLDGLCPACRSQQLSLQRPEPTGDVPPLVQDVLHSPGRPLETGTRQLMETRFSRDFSQVRVHTDGQAAESAGLLQATAYTVGKHIVFNDGQYAPHTSAGEKTIAHELTHTVQQSNVSAVNPQIKLGPAQDSFENQAQEFSANPSLAENPMPVPEARIQRIAHTLSAGGGIRGLRERDRQDRPVLTTADPDIGQLLQFAMQGRWELVDPYEELVYTAASVEQRVAILFNLTENLWTGGNDEERIIGLLDQTPDEQVVEFLGRLRKEKAGGVPLLTRLDQVVDMGNNLILHESLSTLRLREMGPEILFSSIEGALVLPWHDVMGLPIGDDQAVFSVSRTRSGKVGIKYPAHVWATQSKDFGDEVSRLPDKIFSSDGLIVDPKAIIKIHDYDQNRFVIMVAEELAGYQHSGVRGFLSHFANVASLAIPVTEAGSVAGRIGYWTVEKILPILFTLVEENRLRLVRWFPTWGPRLLEFVDIAQKLLLVYGGFRFVQFGWKFVSNWKSIRASRVLSGPGLKDPEGMATLKKVEEASDQLVQSLEEIHAKQATSGFSHQKTPSGNLDVNAPLEPGEVQVSKTPPSVQGEKAGAPATKLSEAELQKPAEPATGPKAPGPSPKTLPEKVVLYRGTTYRWLRGGSGNIHDLGDGVYLTFEPKIALKYAEERRLEALAEEAAKLGVKPENLSGTPGIALKIEANSKELGRVLDFYGDSALRADWEKFLLQQRYGKSLIEHNVASELYNGYLELWLKTRGQRLDMFDTIIGPEYRLGGSQLCIRNPEIANNLMGKAEEWGWAIDKPGGLPEPESPTSGRGILGSKKPAPPPSGPVSQELKVLAMKQFESRWFKFKVNFYAWIAGHGAVDWEALKEMAAASDFRDYASWSEALKSGGFAGIAKGEIIFGTGKILRKIPFLGNSAVQHELVHLYQEMAADALTREALGVVKRNEILRLEIAANVFGSPALVLVYVTPGILVFVNRESIYVWLKNKMK